MNITIKRTGLNGSKDFTGSLIEHEGFQFCIGEADGCVCAIELSTGASVYSKETESVMKIMGQDFDHLGFAERFVKAMDKSLLQSGIDEFKDEHRWIEFPVNNPVCYD